MSRCTDSTHDPFRYELRRDLPLLRHDKSGDLEDPGRHNFRKRPQKLTRSSKCWKNISANCRACVVHFGHGLRVRCCDFCVRTGTQRPGFPNFINDLRTSGRKQIWRIALRDKTGTVVRASVEPTFTKCFALFTHLTSFERFSDVPDGFTNGIADYFHIAARIPHGSTIRRRLRLCAGDLR